MSLELIFIISFVASVVLLVGMTVGYGWNRANLFHEGFRQQRWPRAEESADDEHVVGAGDELADHGKAGELAGQQEAT